MPERILTFDSRSKLERESDRIKTAFSLCVKLSTSGFSHCCNRGIRVLGLYTHVVAANMYRCRYFFWHGIKLKKHLLPDYIDVLSSRPINMWHACACPSISPFLTRVPFISLFHWAVQHILSSTRINSELVVVLFYINVFIAEKR